MSSKSTEHNIPGSPERSRSPTLSTVSSEGAQPLWTLADPGLPVPDIEQEEVEPIIRTLTYPPTPRSSRPLPEQHHHKSHEEHRHAHDHDSVSRGRQRDRDHEYEMRMNAFLGGGSHRSSRMTSRVPSRVHSRTRGVDVGVETEETMTGMGGKMFGDSTVAGGDEDMELYREKRGKASRKHAHGHPELGGTYLTVKHVLPERETTTTTTTTTKSVKD